MSTLRAGAGWQWLTQGFALFRKQPGILSMLLVVNFMLSMVLSAVPLIGPLIATVLIPSFSIAVMQACHQIEQGQRVQPSVLLTGFRQPALTALCKLGLVYMILPLLLMGVMMLMVDDGFLKRLSAPVDPKVGPKIAPSDMWTLFALLGVQAAVLIGLCFSTPLTYWKHMKPGKAIFYSVFAILGAFKAVLTLLASWLGLFLGVSMLVMLLLGQGNAGRTGIFSVTLVFVLLLQCALYAGYRQIFGDPSAPDEKAVDLEKP